MINTEIKKEAKGWNIEINQHFSFLYSLDFSLWSGYSFKIDLFSFRIITFQKFSKLNFQISAFKILNFIITAFIFLNFRFSAFEFAYLQTLNSSVYILQIFP